MHLAPLISDLAVILAVGALVTAIFQKIKQPVVLGYLVAGVIVGTYARNFPLIADFPNVRIWADIGVIFLMFSLGLEFSFRKLSRVGISAGLTALIEVSIMLTVGYSAAKSLGWSTVESLFLAAMVSISSTTIIIKTLEELQLKTRRFAEMIFGILIVEDLFAIVIMVALTTFATNNSFSGVALLTSTGKLVMVVGSWFLTGYFVVPRLVRWVGRFGSDEMLTILSAGLCLSLAVLASRFGYSVALGAFIMGSILAESTESARIEELMKPVRDLFAAVFFVSVGMLIDLRTLGGEMGSIALFTVLVLGGKMLSVTLGALLTGQTIRTSVQVGFGMAQIGEFSFIIAGLGTALRVTDPRLYPIAVAVCLITAFTTPFLFRVSHVAASRIEKALPMNTREFLNRYAAWSQERRADAARRSEFMRRFFRWLANGVLVSVIYVAVAELGIGPTSDSLGWVISTAAAAPFIWGMFCAFRDFHLGGDVAADESFPGDRRSPRGGTLFAFRLATAAWVGILSMEFFPGWIALILTLSFGFGLFIIFFRRLESSYHWFESRFLSAFEDQAKTRRKRDVLRSLAPWDAHLVRIKVHPNSEIAGKKLRDIALRTRFGLNVVAIQRGLKPVIAPGPDEQVFPKDELLVLGTDEQVESARAHIERPPGLTDRFEAFTAYELKNIRVDEGSPLAGKSLKELSLRERFQSTVVGLERNERRMINPDAELRLEAGDILWIVGETSRIEEMKPGFASE